MAPAKYDSGDDAARAVPGARIGMDVRGADGLTLSDRLKDEIQIIYERTRWRPPEVVLVSEIYRSQQFIDLVDEVLFEHDAIVGRLSRSKSSPVLIYSPICPSCRRIQSSQPIELDAKKNRWECAACHTNYESSPGRSSGLITFKLEQALIWKYLSSVVDVHGQDHVEAFEASCDLMQTLKLGVTPLAGRLNLVFDQHGVKLSKSMRNFTPVVRLQTEDLQKLISTYEDTPYRRPISLHEGVARSGP